jgi:hypothetical protein
MPIFLGEASKYFFLVANHLKKIKTQIDTSLNNAQHIQELLCG